MKEREKKILEYMKAEIREKGYPPTVRDLRSSWDQIDFNGA